jgi:hypothetical protein
MTRRSQFPVQRIFRNDIEPKENIRKKTQQPIHYNSDLSSAGVIFKQGNIQTIS